MTDGANVIDAEHDNEGLANGSVRGALAGGSAGLGRDVRMGSIAAGTAVSSIEFSPTRKNLMLARLAAQSEFMKGATRNRENPFAKAKYATLEAVLEAISEPLCTNGLVLTQWAGDVLHGGPNGDRKTMRVYTQIEHAESSEYVKVFLSIPLTKDDAQGIGSAMTYGRRYTLKAALGIPEVDDDGAAASGQESVMRIKPKSARAAKQDGTSEIFNEIQKAIRDAINLEMLRYVGETYRDQIEEMPPGWAQLLRDEYDTKRSELAAVL